MKANCNRVAQRALSMLLVGIAAAMIMLVLPVQVRAQGWSDGFESYATGSFPSSNWTNSGNTTAYVTNSTAESGSNSLYLYGVVGGDWAAIAYRPYTPAPSSLISFSVNNGNESLSGLHQGYGEVELKTGADWSYPGRGLIEFGEDGLIHAGPTSSGELSGPSLGSFVSGTWYDVQIKYQVVDPSTISLSYWIDGTPEGTFDYPSITGEGNLSYLGISSAAGSAWFDNVSIAPVPEPASTALLGLGGVGGMILLRRRGRRQCNNV